MADSAGLLNIVTLGYYDPLRMLVGRGKANEEARKAALDNAAKTPGMNVALEAANAAGYYLGFGIGTLIAGGIITHSTVIKPGAQAIYRTRLSLANKIISRDLAGLRAKPDQTYTTAVGGYTFHMEEIFAAKGKLTPRGAEIVAGIVSGNPNEYRAWFDANWIAGNPYGIKEVPKKAGMDLDYDFWYRRIYDFIMEIDKPFAGERIIQDGYNYDAGQKHKATRKRFDSQPGSVPVNIEIIPGRPAVLDFHALDANKTTYQNQATIMPPSPANFREHLELVFDDWFRAQLAAIVPPVEVPDSPYSEEGRVFIQVRNSAYKRFLEIVDNPAVILPFEASQPALAKREVGSTGRVIHHKIMEDDTVFGPYITKGAGHTHPLRGRNGLYVDAKVKSAVATLNVVKLPLEYGHNSKGMANELDLDFASVATNSTALLDKMGLSGGNYKMKKLSTAVFKEWYDDQWTSKPPGAVPMPGMANYSSYIQGFNYAYRVFMVKLSLAIKPEQYEQIINAENGVMGGDNLAGAKVEKMSVKAMRVLPDKLRAKLDALNTLNLKSNGPYDLLGISSPPRDTYWAHIGNFHLAFGTVYSAYAERIADIDAIVAALTARYPTGSTDPIFLEAKKILDEVRVKIEDSAQSVIRSGFTSLFIDRNYPSGLHAQLEADMTTFTDNSKPLPARVAAFENFAAKFTFKTSPDEFTPSGTTTPIKVIKVMPELLKIRKVVDEWQTNMEARIQSRMFLTEQTHIDNIANRRNLVNALDLITSHEQALEHMRAGINLSDLAHIHAESMFNSVGIDTQLAAIPGLGPSPTQIELDAFKTDLNTLELQIKYIKNWGGAVPIGVNFDALVKTEAHMQESIGATFDADTKARRDASLGVLTKLTLVETIRRVTNPQPPLAKIATVPATPTEVANAASFRQPATIRDANKLIAQGGAIGAYVTILDDVLNNPANPINVAIAGRGININEVEPIFIAAVYLDSLGLPPPAHPNKEEILAATILAME